MYHLMACAVSWLLLLGSFVTAWIQIPQPWTSTDLIVFVIIGTAAAAFARLGLVSIVTLLVRILPSGRTRTLLAGLVVRAMPRVLASSVLAVASTAIMVQAANAAPAVGAGSSTSPRPSSSEAAAPVDPGWPTVGEDSPSSEAPDRKGPDRERVDESPRDPGWPTGPSEDRHGDVDDSTSDAEDDAERRPDRDAADPATRSDASSEQSRDPIHVVEDGESLWSIAAEIADAPEEVPQLVEDMYTANRDTIGPDPSLIIAGQRLEIQP